MGAVTERLNISDLHCALFTVFVVWLNVAFLYPVPFGQLQNKCTIFVLVPRQADFQDVPFVLELAGDRSSSSTMQVCPQTGFPGWSVPAL